MPFGIWGPPPTQKPYAGALLDPTHPHSDSLALCHLYNEGNGNSAAQDFTGVTGGNAWDYSGNGNLGTLLFNSEQRVRYSSGFRNSGIVCNSGLSYVALPRIVVDPRASSLTLIAYLQLYSGGGGTLLGHYDTGSSQVDIGIVGTLYFRATLADGTNTLAVNSGAAVPSGPSSTILGAVVQLAWVWDINAKSIALYQDGALKNSGSNSSLVPANLPAISASLFGLALGTTYPNFQFYGNFAESMWLYSDAKPAGFIAEHRLNPYAGFSNPMTGRWFSFPGGAAPVVTANPSMRKRCWTGPRS